MTKSREEQNEERIAEHRKDIPPHHRALYDKAMSGESRKAAMKAFCLECCSWHIREVFLCTSPACTLFPYRPRSTVSQDTPESGLGKPESTKDSEAGEL